MRRAAVMTLILFTLASCGSEGRSPIRPPVASDRPATSAPAARSEDHETFVRAVNDACGDYAERDAKLADPEGLDEYVPFLRGFIDNAAELDMRLAELEPPSEVEDFDEYVAGNRRQTEILRAALPKLEAAVSDDDQAEADAVVNGAIDAFNAVVDELDAYARRYGFEACESV